MPRGWGRGWESVFSGDRVSVPSKQSTKRSGLPGLAAPCYRGAGLGKQWRTVGGAECQAVSRWGPDFGWWGGRCRSREELGKETRKEGTPSPRTRGIQASSESQILEAQGHGEEVLVLHARPSCFGPEDQEAGTPGPKIVITSTSRGSELPRRPGQGWGCPCGCDGGREARSLPGPLRTRMWVPYSGPLNCTPLWKGYGGLGSRG